MASSLRAALALTVALVGCSAKAQDKPMPDSSAVEQLLDERRLIEIADAIDRAVDAKDWAATRAYFADSIRVTFPGSENAPVKADELVGTWQANLYAEKASFHLRGNHAVEITGDTAIVRSTGYAWNKLDGFEGGDLWEVWGNYEHGFQRADGDWKVTSFAFQPVHQRGNAAIPGFRPGG
jgi:hypothetical protein